LEITLVVKADALIRAAGNSRCAAWQLLHPLLRSNPLLSTSGRMGKGGYAVGHSSTMPQ